MTTRQRSTSSTSTDPPVRREVVLGVDTHGEVHVAAVISPLGKILGAESFPATTAGYRQLLVWARKRGTVRRAGVEGTGTFGAGLSRYLLAQQINSDPLDAQAAARAVLSGRARARAKSGDGPVHSARIFTRQGIRGQGPYPGDQPAQRRPGHRRSRCGNDCPAWATASCSAPAHASGQATARTASARWPRPPI